MSTIRFLRAFSRVSLQVVTTSLVSAFVGICFTVMMIGKWKLAESFGYAFWSKSQIPAFLIILGMLSCYATFLWAAAHSSIMALEDSGQLQRFELIHQGKVIKTHWQQAIWKVWLLLLSPIGFGSAAGAAWMFHSFWSISVPLFSLGWIGWWYGWWRLFQAAERRTSTSHLIPRRR